MDCEISYSKASANGYGKHVGALLYTILDFSESGLKQISPNTSCTEKPRSGINQRNEPGMFQFFSRIYWW